MKDERVRAETRLRAQVEDHLEGDPGPIVRDLESALLAAKIGSYAQGLKLIAEASRVQGWGIQLREMARIWKGGCIIRAALLDTIMRAYEKDPALESILADPELEDVVFRAQPGWRRTVARGVAIGVPLPSMTASLAYFDSYRTARLPQNLTQAQRDAFGAHTYERTDGDPPGAVHTDWLGVGGK
jgi:6-phosphogluconate dehydrogenase